MSVVCGLRPFAGSGVAGRKCRFAVDPRLQLFSAPLAEPLTELDDQPVRRVRQMALGRQHIALLFDDGRVGRMQLDVDVRQAFEKKHKTSRSSGGDRSGGGAGGAAAPTAAEQLQASRTSKMHRVMMAARAARSGRGVIVGSRQITPAASVPEDLIAQAQVVLQSKSREVIVRELQRTKLNVNEAVNNFLSREDDDGDDQTRFVRMSKIGSKHILNVPNCCLRMY